jgi:2-hydroxychromene-2-carboxylate isomerase
MRCVIAADEQGALVAFARAAFEAYWGDLEDVSRKDVLMSVAQRAGLDGQALVARSEAPEIKERLRLNTEEVIARGGFGSPTMFVNGDDMYFGNDRLPLVEAALSKGGAGLTDGSV